MPFEEVPYPELPTTSHLSHTEMEDIVNGIGAEEESVPRSNLSLEEMEEQIFEHDPVLLPGMAKVTSEQMERTLAAMTEPAEAPDHQPIPKSVTASDMEVLRDAA